MRGLLCEGGEARLVNMCRYRRLFFGTKEKEGFFAVCWDPRLFSAGKVSLLDLGRYTHVGYQP